MSNATDDTDWTGVSLRTHVNGLEGSGVTLWNTEEQIGWGGSLATESGLTLTVGLHPADLDEMKALHVGHNSSFTWLTLRMGAFVSLEGGEGNEPVYGTQVVGHSGMAVSDLIEDTARQATYTRRKTSRKISEAPSLADTESHFQKCALNQPNGKSDGLLYTCYKTNICVAKRKLWFSNDEGRSSVPLTYTTTDVNTRTACYSY